MYDHSRYENNNHIFRGKNVLDNKPISVTVKRYLGPPGSIVEGEKIPEETERNPLMEIPLNLISNDALKYVYDENEHIQCAVNPSNLIAPMKINDKIQHDVNSRSSALNPLGPNGSVDIAKAIRSLNPSYFDPRTEAQNLRSFVPDLLYHNEFDKVDSLHNAISKPYSFIPPPIVRDQEKAMTSQSLNDVNYYPVTNNFFSKDPFK